MKWLAVTGACLLLLLTATLGVYHYLEATASQVCGELSGVEQALWGEDWSGAQLRFSQAEEEWQRVRPKWAMLIDHKEMEDIEIGFVDLSSAISRKDLDEAFKEVAELVFFLQQTPEGERPGWENVF